MKRKLLKTSAVVFVVILFSLMSGVALAQKKHWFVVKDKNGVCRVIEAKERTPATIAGPFKIKEEAEKRKAKDCPTGVGQTTDQLRAPQEQDEPMRRQHQRREEPQQQLLKKQQAPQQQQQKLAPQQQQQTEKMKGKAQGKTEGSKPSEEKVKEKTTEPIPSEKKN
jgi:FtsZ-interacting cell division protein ZipA